MSLRFYCICTWFGASVTKHSHSSCLRVGLGNLHFKQLLLGVPMRILMDWEERGWLLILRGRSNGTEELSHHLRGTCPSLHGYFQIISLIVSIFFIEVTLTHIVVCSKGLLHTSTTRTQTVHCFEIVLENGLNLSLLALKANLHCY